MNLKPLLKEYGVIIVIETVFTLFMVSGPFWCPYQISVTYGISMMPTVPPNAVVLIQTGMFDPAHIANGTIIVYKYNETLYIQHRIVEVHYNYYICKGDNNHDIDHFPVLPEEVYAIYITTLLT